MSGFRTQRGAGLSPQRATADAVGLVAVDFDSGTPTAVTNASWRSWYGETDSATLTATPAALASIADAPVGSVWQFTVHAIAQRVTLGGGSSLSLQPRATGGGAIGPARSAGIGIYLNGYLLGAGGALYAYENTNGIGTEAYITGTVTATVTTAGTVELTGSITGGSGTWKLRQGWTITARRIS